MVTWDQLSYVVARWRYMPGSSAITRGSSGRRRAGGLKAPPTSKALESGAGGEIESSNHHRPLVQRWTVGSCLSGLFSSPNPISCRRFVIGRPTGIRASPYVCRFPRRTSGGGNACSLTKR